MSDELCLYIASKPCAPEDVHHDVMNLVKAGGDALGMFMTPNACGLCAWRQGEATGGVRFEGDTNLSEAFEVRAFCEQWELRWIRDGANGVATLLSEDSDQLSGWKDPTEIALADVLERRYLLWGEVDTNTSTACRNGWLTLGSSRTGPIPVPFLSKHKNEGTRVQLVVREYLATFAHGNVCVFDQRLLELADA